MLLNLIMQAHTTVSSTVTALVGSMNLRQTNVSRNSQLYSEHQTLYTLRVEKKRMSKVCNHTDKLHMAKTRFSIEAHEQQLK